MSGSQSAVPQPVDHDALIVDMRAAAAILERFNAAYGYHPERGEWSPQSLRYEADHLEKERDRV